MEKIRLSKLMSEQGLCSRREADGYIERGWVLVDGKLVTELGTKIDVNQRITSVSYTHLTLPTKLL
jgi:23S rRNA pseudouridine2604 synthase